MATGPRPQAPGPVAISSQAPVQPLIVCNRFTCTMPKSKANKAAAKANAAVVAKKASHKVQALPIVAAKSAKTCSSKMPAGLSLVDPVPGPGPEPRPHPPPRAPNPVVL